MAILSSGSVKMTSLLEKIISSIAPHRCIICGNYDNVVCTACTYDMQRLETPLCVLCGSPAAAWQICAGHHSPLARVFAGGLYQDSLKTLIARYKFEHARAVAVPLAAQLVAALPYFDVSWTIVAIPTISAHIRQRGFDHAALLAGQVATSLQLPRQKLLRRTFDTRQVGAGRRQRAKQVRQAFAALSDCAGKRILLIDDVCTTGATLTAAAQVLKRAGAAEVWGAVAAWQPQVKK